MATVKADRAAVLVPGGSRAEGPLLAYAGLAVKRRDGYVHRLEWTGRDRVVWPAWPSVAPVFSAELHTWVESQVSAAVWFTPLLTDEPTVAALRRATAPCLLIGGTADPLWDGPTARSISPHVVEVDGADHGMFVPGPLSASATVLGHVMTAVELFLDQVVW